MNGKSKELDANEQGELISKLIMKMKVEEGKDFYLVSSKWWSSFTSFSNYQYYIQKLEGTEERDQPPKNSNAEKPSKIDNTDLVLESNKLKPRLAEYQNYNLLTKEAWDKLMEWYGDEDTIVICRKGVQIISQNRNRLTIEIYPLHLNIFERLKMNYAPKILQISKSKKISDLIDKICQIYFIPRHKSKLW